MQLRNYFVLQIVINIWYFSFATCKGLNGIHLKFTAYDNPPYEILMVNPDGNYTCDGPAIKVQDWLAKKLNFTYSIVDPIIIAPDQIAKFNIIELAFTKVINKEVDGLLTSVAMSPDRASRMDFTSMVWTEPYTIVARKPGQQSRLFAFIRPFQPMTWLSLLVSVTLITLLMSCFSWKFKGKLQNVSINRRRRKENIYNQRIETVGFYLIYVVNVLTNHGMYIPFSQYSFRMLVSCWLLAALVLVNSYSSIVVSFLTVPVMEPSINTFEDLANNNDVLIILNKNVVFSQVILNATSGIFKNLGDQARRRPDEQLHTNNPSLFKNLETGRYAYPFIQSFNRNFVVQQYKKDGECRFQLSPPLQISTGYFGKLLQKDFPYTAKLSLGLTYLWETGLTRYWIEHDLPVVYKCFDQNPNRKVSIRKVVPIKMEDLASAFLILGIGSGIGLMVFSLELFMFHCFKYNNK